MLHSGFLYLLRAGATLHCGTPVSHRRGFSCCRAEALGARASVVVARGLSCSAACGIFHVGSSRARARTRVPCIGRRILNHCATREARVKVFLIVGLCKQTFDKHFSKHSAVVFDFPFDLGVA